MEKKNPKPRPTICACGASLIRDGERIANPWPEESGPLYTVEIYKCSNSDCSFEPVEYWPEFVSGQSS